MFDVKPVTSEKPFDCGPTCLKMLLAYYGIEVDLETLIKECGLSLAGSTAAALMRVARLHGLEDVQCFSMDADELLRQDRPAIVHWKFGHWIVFAGTDESGRVSICNPDMGRYRMSAETFMTYFTGLDDHPGQGVAIFAGEPFALGIFDNIPSGAIFTYEGKYYRALRAIGRGEEIIVGTNVTPVDVAQVLTNLESKEQ